MRPRVLALALALLPAMLIAGSYPMEGGDLMHSNHAQAPSSLRGPLDEQWAVAMPNLGYPNNHPLLTDDIAYMVSTSGVSALSRKDGGVLWSTYTLTGSNAKTGCLDPGRGLIYVGSQYGYVEALDLNSGAMAWLHTESYASGTYNSASPILLPGQPSRLIFGTAGNGLASLDPDTQTVQWRFAQAQGLNTPAYDQGQLFFTGRQQGLFCVNAANGALVWQASDGLPFNSAVTLDATHLFVMSQTGKVECRLRSNGSLVWSYQTQSFSSSNLGLCNGILVGASDDRHLYAFDAATGNVLWWRTFSGNFARMAPILICGIVYISGCANELYGVELGSGKVLWTFTTDASNSFTDIAVDGDQAFFADSNNAMHCFKALEPADPSTCQCLLQPTPTPAPVPGPCAMGPDPALSLWLDAEQGLHCDPNGLVNRWDDLSGKRHHAVNGYYQRPVLLPADALGRHAVRFNGTGLLRLNRSGGDLVKDPANLTVVLKLRPTPGMTSPQGILCSEEADSGYYQPWLGLNGSMAWGMNNWQGSVQAIPGHCAVTVFRSSPTSQSLRMDGVASGSGPAVVTASAGSAIFTLGNDGQVAGTIFIGDIMKVMVFNRVLSDTEVQALEACIIDPTDPTAPGVTPIATIATPWPVYETRTNTPTITPTATPSPTRSASPSASPTITRTASPSPTATVTASSTPTPSPTATATASPSATPTATPRNTATASPSRTPSPMLSPTRTPAVECGAGIAQVQTWPNPGEGRCQRHISVHLLCSADKVEVDIYSPSGCKVKHEECHNVGSGRDQWVQLPLDDDNSDLGSGLYFVKATVTKGDTKDHATCKMMVLQ